MQAVVIEQTGGPEVLSVEDTGQPQPADGQVLVRVAAASVNPVDWKYRRGNYDVDLPLVLGIDISGTVEASNADGFAEGDEVFGFAAAGGYAELAVADAGALAKKPEGVSHEQAAAIPVAGLTAWQALHSRGGIESGKTVLVAGAAGGVGHFAVQFSRVAGARTIGSGSTRNRDFVLGLGADEYVDYTDQDVSKAVAGADIAFDTVGGDTTATLVPTLAEGGVLVTIAGAPPEDQAAERGARAELLVMKQNGEQLAEIAELVASGEVKPEIAETLPLSDVRRAHELSESGHVRGKIVLTL
jgi:NADPH:quinone reductase-like Zn-dependent oxidoreductase